MSLGRTEPASASGKACHRSVGTRACTHGSEPRTSVDTGHRHLVHSPDSDAMLLTEVSESLELTTWVGSGLSMHALQLAERLQAEVGSRFRVRFHP